MKILLVSPQGSGKSTQALFLSTQFNIPNISTGDIFRKLSSEDSELAKKVKEILESGSLVDDETTAEIAKKRLEEKDCQNGFVLDGYPRNIIQAQTFDPGFDKVLYLNVPRQQVFERLLSRKRDDDTPELINKRLDLYYEQTAPLVEYYRNKGILVEINGERSVQEVQNEIKKHL